MKIQKGGYINYKEFKKLFNKDSHILNSIIFINNMKKLSWDGWIAYDELATTLPSRKNDDMVDALAIQSLMINKPCWWVRFKYWFRRFLHLHP